MSKDGQTHGALVTNIALRLTMFSPLIGAILSLLGAWFFNQVTG